MASPSPPQLYKTASSQLLSASEPLANPRKEFIRDQRVISEFSLLTLAGPGLVRLYSFPGPVITALRRLFDQQNVVITDVREDSPKNFREFTLEGKPWARPKSMESERLLVGILSTIVQCGFNFMSTVDYGREVEDRVAIAFSKPVRTDGPPSFNGHGVHSNTSTATLTRQPKALFGIAFESTTILRVIDPPLQSAPAILQAVRGAWPRGVEQEKKIGDVYEFKLKGYKWFQEDNFPTDSLRHMLSLFTSLDAHSFTLLTSLSLGKRSRVKDLWLFSGPGEETDASPHSSPGMASLELRGGNSTLASNEKLVSIGRGMPGNSSYQSGDSTTLHSSPPNQATIPAKAPGHILRKPSPQAFRSEVGSPPQIVVSGSRSPIDHAQHPFAESTPSLDMTGVGSGLARLDRSGDQSYQSIMPAVLYATSGNQSGVDEVNTSNILGDLQPVETSTPTNEDPYAPSSHLPYFSEREAPAQQYPYIHEPQYHDRSYDAGQHAQHPNWDPARQSGQLLPQDASEMLRSPTPPLLSPGLFRDSAYASTVGNQSSYFRANSSFHDQLIPITWTGREPEGADPRKLTLAGITEQEEPEVRSRSNTVRPEDRAPAASSVPLRARSPSGPPLPGGWAFTAPSQTPRDDRRQDDVTRNMLPPTIPEQPSQERDEFVRMQQQQRARAAQVTPSPSPGPHAGYATLPARSNDRSNAIHRSPPHGSPQTSSPQPTRAAAANGTTRMIPSRQDTDASGWVMVNIQGRGKGKDRIGSPDRGRTTAPNGAPLSGSRPMAHTRSSSDSRLPRSPASPSQQEGPQAMSSMSAAAKAIVLIDAVDAKEREQEKAAQGNAFSRIFKGREKHTDLPAEIPRRRTPDGGIPKTNTPEQEGLKDKIRRHATPTRRKHSSVDGRF